MSPQEWIRSPYEGVSGFDLTATGLWRVYVGQSVYPEPHSRTTEEIEAALDHWAENNWTVAVLVDQCGFATTRDIGTNRFIPFNPDGRVPWAALDRLVARPEGLTGVFRGADGTRPAGWLIGWADGMFDADASADVIALGWATVHSPTGKARVTRIARIMHEQRQAEHTKGGNQ